MHALFSPRWHRVAPLRPALVPQLRLRRQRARGETWMLLSLATSGHVLRLNAAAWRIVGRLDGSRTVGALWDAAMSRDAADDDLATQDDWIALLARLREAGLLRLERPADAEAFRAAAGAVAGAGEGASATASGATDIDAAPGATRSGNTLLAWRVPLVDPTPLLDVLARAGLARALFSRTAFWLWCAAMAAFAVAGLAHAPELAGHAARWFGTPRLAALTVAAYLPVKAVHELAHALATRARGGAVHEAGVTLMLGAPVPYVDASSASAFPRARDRALVAGAGMMAELALAAVALPLWLALPDGLPRDAAFAVLAVAGISTVLFNANPLQRLDGYYLATDLLGLPNLGPRSRAWWQARLQRWLVGRAPGEHAADAAAAGEPPLAPGEAKWLALHAPLAWANGVAIVALSVAWIGQWSFALGLAAAGWFGWQAGLRPLLALWRGLRRAASARVEPAPRWRRTQAAAAAALAVLALLPWPRAARLPGVLWPAEQAQLRAGEDGSVMDVRLPDGAMAHAGDVVLTLRNPALEARLARLSARVAALETALVDTLPVDTAGGMQGGADGRTGDARAELQAAQAELARVQDRVDALVVRAAGDGRVCLGPAEDLAGRWLRSGTLVGQLASAAPPVVRVAWPAGDAGTPLRAGQHATVQLAGRPGQALAATVQRDGAGAVSQLPSAALGTKHGGTLVTDPQDPQDLKAAEPVVVVDVRLDAPLPPDAVTAAAGAGHAVTAMTADAPPARIGERAWVRVSDGHAPLLWQAGEALWRAVARRFNAQG